MKKTFGVILLIPFLVWFGVRIYNNIMFTRDIGGYMLNAASANSIDLAQQEMSKVVGGIEDRKFKPGFTSVIYNTPDEDVGFWISNMRSSLDELKHVRPETTSLERSNILIKLRESLTHKTKGNGKITIPEGISVYPNNVNFFWWGIFSLVLGVIGVIMIAYGIIDD